MGVKPKRPAKTGDSQDYDFLIPPSEKPGRGGIIPPKQHRWKKGESGNPEGGRRHNPVVRALRNLTVEVYREVIEVVCKEDWDELERMSEDRTLPAIQVGVARAFLFALRAGDYATIERIAERIVGKIPDELNVNAKNLNIGATLDPEKLRLALKKLKDEV
jgi:hypothetical protein